MKKFHILFAKYDIFNANINQKLIKCKYSTLTHIFYASNLQFINRNQKFGMCFVVNYLKVVTFKLCKISWKVEWIGKENFL